MDQETNDSYNYISYFDSIIGKLNMIFQDNDNESNFHLFDDFIDHISEKIHQTNDSTKQHQIGFFHDSNIHDY